MINMFMRSFPQTNFTPNSCAERPWTMLRHHAQKKDGCLEYRVSNESFLDT